MNSTLPPSNKVSIELAVPLPVPAPVAVNNTPIVLATAPIRVKSVLPNVLIVYCFVATNAPAVTLYAESRPSNVVPEVASVDK